MILITGYPYVRENYLKTFDGREGEIVFLLPATWPIKGGKVVFLPPERKNVEKTKAFFFHSNYPLVGGALKGFMPMFPWRLFKNRKNIKLVFSATEPVLLSTLYQGFWSKFFGKKHVIFTWENVPYEKKFSGIGGAVKKGDFLKKLILRLNFKFCDGLVCGNQKAAEIHKIYGKAIATIPLSGVDGEKFKPSGLPKIFNGLNWSNKTVILFAGALDYRKGIHILLEAFNRVAEKNGDLHLCIVGSGTYEKEIIETASKSFHKDKITILPWSVNDKLPEIFNASDIFAYPSISYGGWEEQFGYSVAEASLCGLPVIATRSGSIDEVVLDGQTGILVPENDANELESALLKLTQNKELRRSMGEAGRRHIIKNFSYNVIADKFFRFFNKL